LNPKIHNLSLRGITGILIGIISIIYIYSIKTLINQFTTASETISSVPISFFEILLVLISSIFIIISYFTIVLINRKRRKKLHLKRWELKSKRIRLLFLIHLILGGIILYLFLNQGLIKLIIPASLLLYSFFSIIISNFTFGETRILGILFLLNGILSIIFPSQQFFLWGLAFGAYHIIYGLFYYKRV